ncbi:MAG: hypothetical protein ABIJ96_07720 [Elusimicrobiota bacterium]
MNKITQGLVGILLCGLCGAAGAETPPDFTALIQEASTGIRGRIKAARIGESAARPASSVYAENPRCRPESEQGEKIYSSDFRWDYTLPEMKDKFAEMYASAKRLPRRAYWNAEKGRLELPHDAGRGGPVAITDAFVRAVARHIERAYELDYIDGVFFPDMGHSHILIPQALWEEKYNNYGVDKYSRLYEDMYSDPRVEIFYHTAEQLKTREKDGAMVADPRTQWRYKTRNIAGPITADADLRLLQNPESNANTAHESPGYFWWGAGFNLSANENGCFAYTLEGKRYYFDLSLDDIGPAPGAGGDSYY